MSDNGSPFTAVGRTVEIVDVVRTPIGRAHPDKGAFRDSHPVTMLSRCFQALIDRTGIDPAAVEDVIVGCPQPFGEQSRNIARNAWLQAGMPVEVPATTIDRRCGSAQSAVAYAASLIASGTHDVVIAGGVEHMGHIPLDAPLHIAEQYGSPWPEALLERFDFVPQGISAEMIADQWSISRQEMDEYAVSSHRRAAAAAEKGLFDSEIVPIDTPHGAVTRDQGIRPGTTLDQLAGLRTPFRENGKVTAGTSSQLSDGAGAILLVSATAAAQHGLAGKARIFDQVTVGVDPIIMLTGPIPATQKLLSRSGMTVDDIGGV